MNQQQFGIVCAFLLFSAVLYFLRGFESLLLYGELAIVFGIGFIYYGTIGKPKAPPPSDH